MKKIYVFFSFLLCAAAASLAIAQTGEGKVVKPEVGVVFTGDYKDLTVLRQIKLGIAPFVNPGLLTNAAVAYKYEIGDVLAGSDLAAFKHALTDGKAAFGTPNPETNSLTVDVTFEMIGGGVSYDVLPEEEKLKMIQAFLEAAQKRGGVIIAAEDKFSGLKPVGEIVTWQVGSPASAGLPPSPTTDPKL